jgi:proline iminopeptidase/L-proline amide hydrolase
MSGVDRRSLLAMIAGSSLLQACARVAAPPAPPGPPPAPAGAPGTAPDRALMVPVTGGRIYVRVNGDLAGPRPPLLLAHGGPGGHHGSLMPALGLAGDRAIILYDQLDSGRSDRPGDPANWRPERFASEVREIASALGLGRFHLLGHSWGATVALEYASRRPNSLASLILQGPLISTRAWIEDAARLKAQLPREVAATIDHCERKRSGPGPECKAAEDAFYARFWRLRPPPPWIESYEKAAGLASNGAIYNAMWGSSEFSATGTLRHYDGEPLLPRLAMPTLFLIGDSDEVTEATARRFSRAAPKAEVRVIRDAAHRIQTDQPALWVQALETWLRRHD